MPSTPPYPEDFRRDAVALVRSSERSIPVLAKQLGVSPQSLCNRVKQTQLDTGERRDGLTSEEREELRLPRRENRRLEQERDILKSRGLRRRGGLAGNRRRDSPVAVGIAGAASQASSWIGLYRTRCVPASGECG
jgi:transposase